MTRQTITEILSDIRSDHNIFNPDQEPYYRALTEAINIINNKEEKKMSGNEGRPVKVVGVAGFDGMPGVFHEFGARTYISKKSSTPMVEPIGIIEVDGGRVIQLSIGKFVFTDKKGE